MDNSYKLLDLIGCDSSVNSFNPFHNLFASCSGSILIIHDVVNQDKKFVVFHDTEISAVQFSKCGKYLGTIDSGCQPTFALWEVPSLNVSFQIKLPYVQLSDANNSNRYLRGNNGTKVGSSKLFLELLNDKTNKNKLKVVLVYSTTSINKLYLYDLSINRGCSELLLDSTLDADKMITGVVVLKANHYSSGGEIRLFTIEDKLVKIWKIENHCVKLSTKIQTKQSILPNSLILSESLKIVSVICDGNSILFDFSGKFIISLSCQYIDETRLGDQKYFNYNPEGCNDFILKNSFSIEKFVYQRESEDKLIIGTDKGSLLIYTFNGFKLLYFVNYKHELRHGILLNKFEKNGQQIEQLKLPGPNVIFCEFNCQNDIAIIKYADNSMYVCNISSFVSRDYPGLTQTSNFIYSGQYFDASHFKPTTYILWKDDSDKSFISASSDQTLMLWTYKGDRWSSSYFDLLKLLDSNLNAYKEYESQTLNSFTSSMATYIKCILFHPKFGNILVAGDNRGCIFIFDVGLKSMTLSKKVQIAKFPIEFLSFNSTGYYLLIGFESGLMVFTEFMNDCKICCNINEPSNEMGNSNQIRFNFGYIMSERVGNISSTLSYNKNSRIEQTKSFIYSASDSAIRVLSSKNSRNLVMQSVVKANSRYFVSVMREIHFSHAIVKTIVHPSQSYIISLLSNNQIQINRVESDTMCGQITVEVSAIYDMKIDPSGLYLGLTIDQQELSGLLANYNNHNEVDQSSKSISSPNSVLFYEVGTGRLVSVLSNTFPISTFQFSGDGRFLILSSITGVISVWQLIKEISENIMNVLDEMKRDFLFWNVFTINYGLEPNIAMKEASVRSKSENFFDDHAQSKSKFRLQSSNQITNDDKLQNNIKLRSINQCQSATPKNDNDQKLKHSQKERIQYQGSQKIFQETNQNQSISASNNQEKEMKDLITQLRNDSFVKNSGSDAAHLIRASQTKSLIHPQGNPNPESKMLRNEKSHLSEGIQTVSLQQFNNNRYLREDKSQNSYKRTSEGSHILKEAESAKSIKNFNAIDLQPELIRQIINRKNYFIKNSNPDKLTNISDPTDIDDLDSAINLQHPFNAKIVEKAINYQSEQQPNEASLYNKTGNNITEDVEFVYDHIYEFDKKFNFNQQTNI